MEETQQYQNRESPRGQRIDESNPMGPQIVKEKHKYIFPNILAKMMKNVSMQVQFESSLMACALILIGLLLMAIYLFAFGDQTIAYKVILGINLIGGFIFMSSSLVTTYQQYQSYMDITDFQKSMGMSSPQNKVVKKYNRKNQFLFFGGVLFLIAAFIVPNLLVSAFSSMVSFEYYILGALALIGILLMIAAIKKPKQKKIPPQITHQIIQKPVQLQVQQRSVTQPITERQVIKTTRTLPIQQQPRPIQAPAIINKPIIQRVGLQNKLTALPMSRPIATRPVQRPVAQPIVRAPVVQQRIIQQSKPVQAVQIPVQRQQMPAQRQIQAAKPGQIQSRSAFSKNQAQIVRPQVPQMRVISPTEFVNERPKKPGLFARLKEKLSKRKTVTNQIYGSQARPINKKEVEMLKKVEQSFNKQMYDIGHMKAQERRS